MDSTKTLDDKAIDAAIREWMASDDMSADGFRLRMRAAIAAALSAQGEAAQPAAGAWVDWPGLKQPVDDDTIIEFLADDGVIERRLARYMRWELPFEYRLPASPNAASQDGGR